MTENTTTVTESTTEAPAATSTSATTAAAKPVLMQRDYRKGGKGVTKIYVKPEQIADFAAAGWKRV